MLIIQVIWPYVLTGKKKSLNMKARVESSFPSPPQSYSPSPPPQKNTKNVVYVFICFLFSLYLHIFQHIIHLYQVFKYVEIFETYLELYNLGFKNSTVYTGIHSSKENKTTQCFFHILVILRLSP